MHDESVERLILMQPEMIFVSNFVFAAATQANEMYISNDDIFSLSGRGRVSEMGGKGVRQRMNERATKIMTLVVELRINSNQNLSQSIKITFRCTPRTSSRPHFEHSAYLARYNVSHPSIVDFEI